MTHERMSSHSWNGLVYVKNTLLLTERSVEYDAYTRARKQLPSLRLLHRVRVVNLFLFFGSDLVLCSFGLHEVASHAGKGRGVYERPHDVLVEHHAHLVKRTDPEVVKHSARACSSVPRGVVHN